MSAFICSQAGILCFRALAPLFSSPQPDIAVTNGAARDTGAIRLTAPQNAPRCASVRQQASVQRVVFDDVVDIVLLILQREKACHVPELINRAYAELRAPAKAVLSACTILEGNGRVGVTKCQAQDSKRTTLSFLYDADQSHNQIDQIIQEKAGLMRQHYDLSETIGRHGERIVSRLCEDLGYTEIALRKEKHGETDLGLGHHDLDVFARHPSGDYLQYIEVKNRRAQVLSGELTNIVETALAAGSRWKLDKRPSLVAPFVAPTAIAVARINDLPIAYSEGVYVPEEYRPLYEHLNLRLALNAIISDMPNSVLRDHFRRYIVNKRYRPRQCTSSANGPVKTSEHRYPEVG